MLNVSKGFATGIDMNEAVTEMLRFEHHKIETLQTKKSIYNVQISAYGALKSSFSDLQDAANQIKSTDQFEIYKTYSQDEAVFTASANSAATAGLYDIAVNQLAQAHKLASQSVSDQNASISATGTMQITVNGESFSVDVDSENDNLQAIKQNINQSLDNHLVKASILSVDDGLGGTEHRLVLSALNSGSDNAITVSDLLGNVASTLVMETELTAAQDAVITVDGFTITQSTNAVTNAIEGVDLYLHSVSPQSKELTVERDLDAVTDKIQNFVDNYNALMGKINAYKSNELEGENDLRLMTTSMLNVFLTEVEDVGAYDLPIALGISTEKENTLKLDHAQFKSALQEDIVSAINFFTDDEQGFSNRMDELVDSFVKYEGIMSTRTRGLESRVHNMDDRIERQETLMTKREEGYRKRWIALDGAVSKINATGQNIIDQLANFPQIGGNKK